MKTICEKWQLAGWNAVVLMAALLLGSGVALAQSCPASSTSGDFSYLQNQGGCGMVCAIDQYFCYKIRCFKCGQIDFVYGQDCESVISDPGVCTGCS